MNKVIFLGTIGKDPEVKYTQEGLAVARTSMALNQGKDKSTTWVNLVAFGKSAEFAENFVKKGRRFGVVGRVQTGSYEDKNKNKVYTTDFVVEQWEFADSKPEGKVHAEVEKASGSDDFMAIPDGIDEELPFV